jgi:hypothetical protein
MEIDKWIAGCKVRIFPWIDHKHIYVNVRYFRPGQSIQQPPAWDRTVYITDNPNGRRLAYEFTDTLTHYVSTLNYPDGYKVVITA